MMRLGEEDDPWLQMGLSRTARREEVNRTYRYANTSSRIHRFLTGELKPA